MDCKYIVYLFFFCITYFPLAAQEDKTSAYSAEQELIQHIEKSSSKERILALCLYQEWAGHYNIPPKKLDDFFKELERITATDKEFKRFVDFYKRLSPTMFIPEKDRETTHKKMIALYEKTIDHYLSVRDDRFAGMCLVHSGFDRFMLGDYENSIENMLQGYELLKKAGFEDNPVSPKYLHDMALVFIFFGEYEKVVELMEVSANIPPIDINRDIQQFNNLGVAYLALGNRQKAEEAFLKVIERAKAHKVNIWIALALSKIASMRFDEGKYEEALELYEKASPLIKKEESPREYAENALHIAKIYLKKENPEEALRYIQLVHNLPFEYTHYFGEKQQFEKYWQFYYEVNQLYYKAVNNYKKAYLYSDSLTVLNQRQDSVYNILRVHLAREKLNVEKTQNEKNIIRIRMWAIGVVALLAVVILTLLYYINRIRRAKEKAEHLYKEKIMQEEQQRLNNELQVLKTQLENHLKKIAENNRLIEQYKKEAKEMGDSKINIDNLKILTKEHWENFIRDFRKAHKKFYTKITRQYPYLTPSELRMILLLKLGITQKELPGVLGTSDVNIRVTLHRLRHKIAKNEPETKDKEIFVLINTP